MLTHLSIKNYALIDNLNVAFGHGFTTITGETGAGKSILLGAFSLVLGKRADLSSLKNKDEKCIIEAEFTIGEYHLEEFFKENDLDYERESVLRREILPSGKSRAFINDTPVTLDVLSWLGGRLVDIHSQHQTLLLTQNTFQFKVVDALAGNSNLLDEYQTALENFKLEMAALEELLVFQSESAKELDYNTFLWQELEKAPLQVGILEELEEEYGQLSNVETMLELLSQINQLLHEEQYGILTSLGTAKQMFQKLDGFGKDYKQLNERAYSLSIELEDIASELERLKESVEANPQRLDEVNGQLQTLHDLFKKHQVSDVKGLIVAKEELAKKVGASESVETKILVKEKAIARQKEALEKYCKSISQKRKGVLPRLKGLLEEKISQLGMPSASFKIEISPTADFKSNGKDDLTFMFSANKGSNHGELKKVASGGELSRIMLAIKSTLAKYEQLPTLMFDEIDSGVSGEISNKMGEIMQHMGEYMQVFSITHLPQVASRGKHQFKVYKEEKGDVTHTRIKQLSEVERIAELAEMLSGKAYSESAVNHAKELLGATDN